MCISNSARMPVAPQVAAAPTREGVTGGTDPAAALAQTKNIVKNRQGVFGNIRTTPLGDASYGAFSNFASFGRRAA